jgi:hypothetical protein
MARGPAHRALAAFDIEKSDDPGRTDDIQRATRSALRAILRDAVDGASIGWSRCRWLDRGAGGVLVAPGQTESRVVDPLVGHLAAGLRRYNLRSSALARIRLRMAAHAGPVHEDLDELTGAAMVHVVQLLDAPLLGEHLALTSAELAMLVSDPLYDQIVKHDTGLLDPAAFRPVVIRVTETSTVAWLLASAETAAPTSLDGPPGVPGQLPATLAADRPGAPLSAVDAVPGISAIGPVSTDAPADHDQCGWDEQADSG